MMTFLRALPNTLWWTTVFLAVLALFSQVAIAIGRSGTFAPQMLLVELVVTVALLALPVGIAWRGRRENSLWDAGGGLVLLLALGRIFFF